MSIQRELRETFETRIARLARELERAVKRGTPAILLVIYASEWVREEVERELRRRIADLKQTAVSIQVDKEHADIPTTLDSYQKAQESIFLISGLGWGGGEDGLAAYRALNLRREWFIEKNWRAVFWLSENEAVTLARQTPDFWAFRHRVIEFVEPPEIAHRAAVAQEMAWHDLADRSLREDTQAKIQLREELLAELPDQDETRAPRGDLLYTLGALYATAGEYPKAEQAFKQAIELDPKIALPWNGLGNVYHDLGRCDEAIQAYQKAIELDPKSVLPWNGLGSVYRDLGRRDEAIQAYQKAIELDPKYAYPWNGLGSVYRDLGRRDEAIQAYQKAIELDPKDAYPWNNLGNVYDDLGRHDEALQPYQKAIELDPTYPSPWYNLGTLYAKTDDNEQALAAFRNASELKPGNDEYRRRVIETLKKLGRQGEAEELEKSGRARE